MWLKGDFYQCSHVAVEVLRSFARCQVDTYGANLIPPESGIVLQTVTRAVLMNG